MAESKGAGETGAAGGTGGSEQRSLEMRVAELEDRLSKMSATAEQGGAVACNVPCMMAFPCQGCLAAPPPCTVAQQGVQACIAQQGVQACIAQQRIFPCLIRCIIRCIIDPIIFNPPNDCIPGCAPGGFGGAGGFGSFGM